MRAGCSSGTDEEQCVGYARFLLVWLADQLVGTIGWIRAAARRKVSRFRESWKHIGSPTLQGFEAHVRGHGSHLNETHNLVDAGSLQRVGELVRRLARAVRAHDGERAVFLTSGLGSAGIPVVRSLPEVPLGPMADRFGLAAIAEDHSRAQHAELVGRSDDNRLRARRRPGSIRTKELRRGLDPPEAKRQRPEPERAGSAG